MPTGVYIRTGKHRRIISESLKGHPVSILMVEKLIERNKSAESRERVSKYMASRVVSPETRRRMSGAAKGRIPWNKGLTKNDDARIMGVAQKLKGRVLAPEHKAKVVHPIGWHHTEQGKANIKANRPDQWGARNPSWNGGTSFVPYPPQFNKRLKARIRQRDNYTCCICGAREGKKYHAIHHIDYNKENCEDSNLLTLCQSCNGKVNKNRIYWQFLLTPIAEEVVLSKGE